MDRVLFALVIVGLLVWYFLGRSAPPPPAPAPPAGGVATATATGPAALLAPSQARLAQTRSSARAEIEAACKKHDVTIVSYRESPDFIVELDLKGRDRNSLNDVLDELLPPNGACLKDVMSDAMRYGQLIENGQTVHYAHYKIRAFN